MFPYPHRRSITAAAAPQLTIQQQQRTLPSKTKTTLDDAIRTDLQHVLLPLYQQRLQQHQLEQHGTQMSSMSLSSSSHNSSINTTSSNSSVYTKVFLPHYIETKMGLLLRRQSIVTTRTTTTTSTTTSSHHSYYYGFLPTQRCDYHSYIQFVFTIIQEYIQSTMKMMRIRSIPNTTTTTNNNNNHPNLYINAAAADDDDDNTNTMLLVTLSFYIFTFYTWIQMLHPPPPSSHIPNHHHHHYTSTKHTKTTTTMSTISPYHHHNNNNSNNDTILLSYLSMGLQSSDNPKVLYRRMYDHSIQIRMTISFYHSLVQLLQQMNIGSTVQQQHVPTRFYNSRNSDDNHQHYHPQQYTRRRHHQSNMIQNIIQNDIIHILQRLLNHANQYFDLSSYHGPCHLEGYTWQKQQQQQQQHGHPDPHHPLPKSNTVTHNTITTFHAPPPPPHIDNPATTMNTAELKQSNDDDDDDDSTTVNMTVKVGMTQMDKGKEAATTTIHEQIRSYWQLHSSNQISSTKGIHQSILPNVNNATDPSNNPLLHLLRTYYNDGHSRTHSDNDNEHMDMENDLLVMVDTETMTNTIHNHNDKMTNPISVTANNPMEKPLRRNQMVYELPQRRSGDDMASVSHHELEEVLIWDDSENDDNGIDRNNDILEAIHDDDDHDSYGAPSSYASSIPNNIGTTALSKLLQHATDHHQPSLSSRPSNVTYGDVFLLPPNEDMESKLSTVDVQQRTKYNTMKNQITKPHRKESKSKPSTMKKKRPSKKSLSSTPTALMDDALTFGDQRSNHEIYIDEEDDDIIMDDDDNVYEDDSSNHETDIATPGQSALSKLLAMARPV